VTNALIADLSSALLAAVIAVVTVALMALVRDPKTAARV
jgi:hypothetical protein